MLFLVAAMAVFFAATISAFAVGLDGTSRSYLVSRERGDGTKLMPGYEYLDFSIRDLGDESISAHFGGWGSYDFKEKTGDTDVQYAYVSLKRSRANGAVTLGRIMVFEGVAAERVDGAFARTDLGVGFGISAFGGAPVLTNDIDTPGNNVIYGGRISHQLPDHYTIGVSYLKEERNSTVLREEEGVDLWFKPVNKVEILGRSSYNAETTGWMEHSYNLMLGPFSDLRLTTDLTKISYADYFIGATTSAFILQTGGSIDPREKLDQLGETLSYSLSERVNLSAEYTQFSYDLAGDAKRYGLSAAYAVPRSVGVGGSVHRMDGNTDRLSYDQYRIYAFMKFGNTDAAVDVLDVKYAEPINGVTNAYAASLALGYELTDSLKLGIDGEYAKNPDFDKDVRLFAKLLYRFDFAGGSATGPVTGSLQRPAKEGE